MRDFRLSSSSLVASYNDNVAPVEQSLEESANKEEKMKLRYVAPLAIAASAAAIGLAPIAAADTTVQQSPGNTQITATPGAAAQQAAQNQTPFGGESGALLFHHG
jgi:hypothetical protein